MTFRPLRPAAAAKITKDSTGVKWEKRWLGRDLADTPRFNQGGGGKFRGKGDSLEKLGQRDQWPRGRAESRSRGNSDDGSEVYL